MPLDIRRLQRSGVLTPGQACSWQWTVNDRVRASIQFRADNRILGVSMEGIARQLGFLDKLLGEARTHLDWAP